MERKTSSGELLLADQRKVQSLKELENSYQSLPDDIFGLILKQLPKELIFQALKENKIKLTNKQLINLVEKDKYTVIYPDQKLVMTKEQLESFLFDRYIFSTENYLFYSGIFDTTGFSFVLDDEDFFALQTDEKVPIEQLIKVSLDVDIYYDEYELTCIIQEKNFTTTVYHKDYSDSNIGDLWTNKEFYQQKYNQAVQKYLEQGVEKFEIPN